MDTVSAAEITYLLEGVALDMREDGRARLDFNHLSLEVGLLPQTSGSARLRTGGMDLLVGVVAVLAEPDPALPDLGRIVISVSCGPGDAVAAGLPDYATDAMARDDKVLWIERSLAQLYSHQTVPDGLRTLCIAAGRQCWELRVHVQLLRADGCPLDAAALAVRAALHDTHVPHVAVGEGQEDENANGSSGGTAARAATLDLDLDESLDESTPFAAEGMPLYVTLATLDGHLVADCTAKERRAAGSAVSLALDGTGKVCAICAGGGFGLQLGTLSTAMQVAQQLGGELHRAARDAIHEAARAAEARGGALLDDGSVGLLG